MIYTLIICLTIVAIVAVICYTIYKVRTCKVKILDKMYSELTRLKESNTQTDDMLDKVWDNIQEIKQYLHKVVNKE